MLKRLLALHILCILFSCSNANGQIADERVLNFETAQKWANSNIGKLVEDGRVTGAVVSIVKDGKVIYASGYGLGDVVAKTASSASTTRVRIGSTTKTFTATIIAQLMDEGVIASLDDPANKYLKRYKLPKNDDEDIRLRHLLTHTAGFEDKFYAIGLDKPVEIPVQAEAFERLRPPYARPVDEQVVYSNFGVATLGLVIEDLTGLPIDDVMKRRIFDPLEMNDTDLLVTIQEPEGLAKPGDIAPDASVTGPTKFVAINPAVAQTGSIVSTAADMAKYMNAHLGHGDILTASAQKNLQTRIADNASEISGLGMVFIVDDWAGHKTVSHGGNWAGFHTWMTLLPDDDIGVFVSLLSNAKAPRLVDRFISAVAPSHSKAQSPALLSALSVSNGFLDDQYGPKRQVPTVDMTALENLKQYAGYYRSDRRPFSFAEELSSLVFFGADVLKVNSEINGLYLGQAGPFVPVDDSKFVLESGSRPMTIIRPNMRTGKLTIMPEIGIYTFTKIPWWANPKLHAILIHIALPLTLLCLLAPFVFGRNGLGLSVLLIGVSALIMLAASLGLPKSHQTMMDGYYTGHLGRLAIFISGANLMLVAVIVSCVQAYRTTIIRYLHLALLIPSFIVLGILSQYNALGFKLI